MAGAAGARKGSGRDPRIRGGQSAEGRLSGLGRPVGVWVGPGGALARAGSAVSVAEPGVRGRRARPRVVLARSLRPCQGCAGPGWCRVPGTKRPPGFRGSSGVGGQVT